jgi:hypothetical protein
MDKFIFKKEIFRKDTHSYLYRSGYNYFYIYFVSEYQSETLMYKLCMSDDIYNSIDENYDLLYYRQSSDIPLTLYMELECSYNITITKTKSKKVTGITIPHLKNLRGKDRNSQILNRSYNR